METILSIAATAIGLLITTITFIYKFVSAIKEKKWQESLKLLNDFTSEAIQKAEMIKSLNGDTMTGDAKKQYAITEIENSLSKVGLYFDVKTIANKIEEIIVLTKKVNAREKDLKIINEVV